ncbi:histidine phosphatase family protein [Duganella sp. FT94W]|uniref:Histidine phosphatase family protein n=1 Tax=Duganella lactea TaxID=2692173 RepID=A0ABW9V9H1_9BURK|nr:histidine phosphatase family protein [Duganella lactea]MYM35442.1 histidine phosphatase family protein [Duganella lactea]
MGQIFLVRHGQASFGKADYDQLSALGLEQARLLGRWYANTRQRFDKVIHGGMTRHRQTAEACLGELPTALLPDAQWITDDDFAEFDHKEVLLRHCPAFADADAFKAQLANEADPSRALEQLFRAAMQRWMDGGDYTESWPAFRGRCVRALARLDAGGGKRTTIVFTSGGVIAALMQHLLGLQDTQTTALNWSLANCGVTRLLHRPGQFTLNCLNNYAHLEWLGQPGAVTYR